MSISEITIIAINVPIPQPIVKKFQALIVSEDEDELNKIIENIKILIPTITIKDKRL